MPVAFRPLTPEDLPFLREVYASIRREELAVAGWEPAQEEAFIDQQFHAQHAYYQDHYAGADWLVILRGGEPVGRLYVARWPAEIRIIDIALLPACRNGGLGSRILRELQAEGAASGRPLTIHVEKHNPALRLYRRLGFAEVEDRGVYWFMRWAPPNPAGGLDRTEAASA